MTDTPHTLVAGVDTPASTSMPHVHHHPHIHHAGKNVRQFLRPDGKKVHIASSPDEANQLRRKLSTANEMEDFDLFIHGSPEHVSTGIVFVYG